MIRKEICMSRWGRCGDSEASGRVGKAMRTPAAVVAALVLVLSMSLMAFGCGDDTSGPEAAVQKWLTALANQDIDTLIEVTNSPEDLAALSEEEREELKYGPEAEMVRSLGSLEFSDITMETVQEGDEAVVTITGGSVTLGGMGVTMDLVAGPDTGFPTEFQLYELDGKWYLNMEE
jgi:hypothetical protein